MPPSESLVRAWAYENEREDMQALVPAASRRILDLGCASGALGAALKGRQQCEVIGIESNPGLAEAATRRLDRVITVDLEAFAGRDDLAAELGSFDCLVAGDVLEHLVDPWLVLRAYSALLEPGGTAVVSLPNVRYWQLFWSVGVKGTWPRHSVGVFDRTHLRWFTLRDAHELLEQASLDVVTVDRRLRLSPSRPLTGPLAQVLARTPGRTLLTFQHLLVGRRRAGAGGV
jgi:methionine biosynthesis protein MetW